MSFTRVPSAGAELTGPLQGKRRVPRSIWVLKFRSDKNRSSLSEMQSVSHQNFSRSTVRTSEASSIVTLSRVYRNELTSGGFNVLPDHRVRPIRIHALPSQNEIGFATNDATRARNRIFGNLDQIKLSRFPVRFPVIRIWEASVR